MVYIDPVLRFQKLPGRNGKNILREEYQKERIKYKGRTIPLYPLEYLSFAIFPLVDVS